MKTEQILPKTIIRTTSEQNVGDGACDNLVNLRYEYGTLKVVPKKTILDSSITYTGIYEHRTDGHVNMIGTHQQDGYVEVYWIKADTSVLIASYHVSSDIDIAFLGNLLCVSVKEPESYGGKRIESFIFRDNKYSLYSDGTLPSLPGYHLSDTDETHAVAEAHIEGEKELTPSIIADYALSLFNKMRHNDNVYASEGCVLVSINFSLADGTETKPSSPKIAILGTHKIDYSIPVFANTNYANMHFTVSKGKNTGNTYMSAAQAINGLTFTLYPETIPDYKQYKDIIKSINIYTTYPASRWDLKKSISGTNFDKYLTYCMKEKEGATGHDYTLVMSDSDDWIFGSDLCHPERSSNEWVRDQIFYLQKSIPFGKDTAEMSEPFKFIFDETLLSRRVMKVDSSGYVKNYGKMTAYNGRLHLHDVYQTLMISQGDAFIPLQGSIGASVLVDLVVAVYMKDTFHNMTHVFNVSAGILALSSSSYGAEFRELLISYPDSRAYRIEIYHESTEAGMEGVYMESYDLEPSEAYNYAYHILDTSEFIMELKKAPEGTSVPSVNSSVMGYASPDTVLVSGAYMPAYYSPYNSYRVNGTITSLLPMADSVSDLQVGQFPLAVLTDNGIFALNQGSGEVLYSGVAQISGYSCPYGNSIQTRTGIYFISQRGLYRLSKGLVKLITDTVRGENDKDIEECPQYALCCQSDQTYIGGILPNIEDFLNEDAVLSYDSFRDELYVSNKYEDRSFVYNIKTDTWHSSDLLVSFSSGEFAVDKSLQKIIYMDTEEKESVPDLVMIHLQTRAVTLGGYGYESIHRVVARGDFFTTDRAQGGMIGMYLFASNDMTQWDLVGATQIEGRADKMQLDHISASHRYYVIVIGGYAYPTTRIGNIQFEIRERYTGKLR